MAHKILILGGTTEARQLAQMIAGRSDLDCMLSLAGRTSRPVAQAVPVRIGGFGGVDGLADYLRHSRTDVLIDATHPFAAIISGNAAKAARQTGVAHFAIRRPPWQKVSGDLWREVDDVAGALALAGQQPRHVFAALGRQQLASLAVAPFHHYVIRSIEPVTPPPPLPHASYLLARGPFDVDDEMALLRRHDIDLVIAKNSGGAAACGKLAAARRLGIEVCLIRRPALPDVRSVDEASAAIALLDHLLVSPGGGPVSGGATGGPTGEPSRRAEPPPTGIERGE